MLRVLLMEDEEPVLDQFRHGTYAVDGQGRAYMLNEILSQLKTHINPDQFFRLNRAEIVQLAAIERLEPYFNDTLTAHLRGALPTALTSSTHRTPELRRLPGLK